MATMSSPGAFGGLTPEPQNRAMETVASYPDYASAQRAVDQLSDSRFPVQHAAIVGTDLRLEEHVLGRLTVGRAALAGAGSGVWIGTLIGLLFGLFTNEDWWKVLLWSIVLAAIWGAILGALSQAMTRGQRDFVSRRALRAGSYAVQVAAEHAGEARRILGTAGLTGQGAA